MVMDASTAAAAITGVVLPLIISLILSWHASRQTQTIVAFVACLVATALVMFLRQLFAWGSNAPGDIAVHIIINLVAVFVTTVTTFQGLWKPLGVTDTLEKRGASVGG